MNQPAATATAMALPEDRNPADPMLVETTDSVSPMQLDTPPVPPLRRSAEVVDLQADYTSEEEVEVQVQNGGRPANKRGSVQAKEPFGMNFTQPTDDILYAGKDYRPDLARAFRALYPTPRGFTQEPPAYDPPWGAYQAPSIARSQLSSQDFLYRNNNFAAASRAVPQVGSAYEPPLGTFQAPAGPKSQLTPQGLLSQQTYGLLYPSNEYRSGFQTARNTPLTTPEINPQIGLAYASPLGAYQAPSVPGSQRTSPSVLNHNDVLHNSAAKEEVPVLPTEGSPGTSLQPIHISGPAEASPSARPEEQQPRPRKKGADTDPTKYEADRA